MNIIVVDWNNASLNAHAATFAKRTMVKLIGRPYLNVFNLELIFFKTDFYMKLIFFRQQFVSISAAQNQVAQQEN